MEHPFFSARRFVWYLPGFALLGAGIGLLLDGLSFDPGWQRRIIASAIVGISCGSFGVLLELLVYSHFRRLSDQTALVARVPVFALGGILGYIVGRQIAIWLLFPTVDVLSAPRHVLGMLAFCAVLGVMFGGGTYIYQNLKRRLGDSIARLKEAEFAERELTIAREMQKRLLPEGNLRGDGWQVVARNDAARFVAGDFYDVFSLPDGSLGLVVADVAGKGMGASLIMATAKALIPMLAATSTPAATLEALRERLRKDLSSREFVAIAIGRYQPDTGLMQIANAGLPDPWIRRIGGSIEIVDVPGPRLPVGRGLTVRYENAEVRLGIGDRLILFSDGLPEAPIDGGDELIGYERLEQIVKKSDGPLESWVNEIVETTVGSGHALSDDVTILALERQRSGAAVLPTSGSPLR